MDSAAFITLLVLTFLLPGFLFHTSLHKNASKFSYSDTHWRRTNTLSQILSAAVIIHLTLGVMIAYLFFKDIEVFKNIQKIYIYMSKSNKVDVIEIYLAFGCLLAFYTCITTIMSKVFGFFISKRAFINHEKRSTESASEDKPFKNLLFLIKNTKIPIWDWAIFKRFSDGFFSNIWFKSLLERKSASKNKVIIDAVILTTIKEKSALDGDPKELAPRCLIYRGYVFDMQINEDGEISYIILSPAFKVFSHQDKWPDIDDPKWSCLYTGSRFDGYDYNDDYVRHSFYVGGDIIQNVHFIQNSSDNLRLRQMEVAALRKTEDIDSVGAIKVKKIQQPAYFFHLIIIPIIVYILYSLTCDVVFNAAAKTMDRQMKLQENEAEVFSPPNIAYNFYIDEQDDGSQIDINGLFKTSGMNVVIRSAPSKFARKIGTINDQEIEVKVIGKVKESIDWYQIELPDGQAGYIFAPLLKQLDGSL